MAWDPFAEGRASDEAPAGPGFDPFQEGRASPEPLSSGRPNPIATTPSTGLETQVERQRAEVEAAIAEHEEFLRESEAVVGKLHDDYQSTAQELQAKAGRLGEINREMESYNALSKQGKLSDEDHIRAKNLEAEGQALFQDFQTSKAALDDQWNKLQGEAVRRNKELEDRAARANWSAAIAGETLSEHNARLQELAGKRLPVPPDSALRTGNDLPSLIARVGADNAQRAADGSPEERVARGSPAPAGYRDADRTGRYGDTTLDNLADSLADSSVSRAASRTVSDSAMGAWLAANLNDPKSRIAMAERHMRDIAADPQANGWDEKAGEFIGAAVPPVLAGMMTGTAGAAALMGTGGAWSGYMRAYMLARSKGKPPEVADREALVMSGVGAAVNTALAVALPAGSSVGTALSGIKAGVAPTLGQAAKFVAADAATQAAMGGVAGGVEGAVLKVYNPEVSIAESAGTGALSMIPFAAMHAPMLVRGAGRSAIDAWGIKAKENQLSPSALRDIVQRSLQNKQGADGKEVRDAKGEPVKNITPEEEALLKAISGQDKSVKEAMQRGVTISETKIADWAKRIPKDWADWLGGLPKEGTTVELGPERPKPSEGPSAPPPDATLSGGGDGGKPPPGAPEPPPAPAGEKGPPKRIAPDETDAAKGKYHGTFWNGVARLRELVSQAKAAGVEKPAGESILSDLESGKRHWKEVGIVELKKAIVDAEKEAKDRPAAPASSEEPAAPKPAKDAAEGALDKHREARRRGLGMLTAAVRKCRELGIPEPPGASLLSDLAEGKISEGDLSLNQIREAVAKASQAAHEGARSRERSAGGTSPAPAPAGAQPRPTATAPAPAPFEPPRSGEDLQVPAAPSTPRPGEAPRAGPAEPPAVIAARKRILDLENPENRKERSVATGRMILVPLTDKQEEELKGLKDMVSRWEKSGTTLSGRAGEHELQRKQEAEEFARKERIRESGMWDELPEPDKIEYLRFLRDLIQSESAWNQPESKQWMIKRALGINPETGRPDLEMADVEEVGGHLIVLDSARMRLHPDYPGLPEADYRQKLGMKEKPKGKAAAPQSAAEFITTQGGIGLYSPDGQLLSGAGDVMDAFGIDIARIAGTPEERAREVKAQIKKHGAGVLKYSGGLSPMRASELLCAHQYIPEEKREDVDTLVNALKSDHYAEGEVPEESGGAWTGADLGKIRPDPSDPKSGAAVKVVEAKDVPEGRHYVAGVGKDGRSGTFTVEHRGKTVLFRSAEGDVRVRETSLVGLEHNPEAEEKPKPKLATVGDAAGKALEEAGRAAREKQKLPIDPKTGRLIPPGTLAESRNVQGGEDLTPAEFLSVVRRSGVDVGRVGHLLLREFLGRLRKAMGDEFGKLRVIGANREYIARLSSVGLTSMATNTPAVFWPAPDGTKWVIVNAEEAKNSTPADMTETLLEEANHFVESALGAEARAALEAIDPSAFEGIRKGYQKALEAHGIKIELSDEWARSEYFAQAMIQWTVKGMLLRPEIAGNPALMADIRAFFRQLSNIVPVAKEEEGKAREMGERYGKPKLVGRIVDLFTRVLRTPPSEEVAAKEAGEVPEAEADVKPPPATGPPAEPEKPKAAPASEKPLSARQKAAAELKAKLKASGAIRPSVGRAEPEDSDFAKLAVEAVIGNRTFRGPIPVLKSTPAPLMALGAADRPLVVDQAVLRRARDKHQVSVNDLGRLPLELRDPLAIFQSEEETNAVLVLTGLTNAQGYPVAPAIRFDQRAGRFLAHEIVTLSKRQEGELRKWIAKDLLYKDETRWADWLRQRGLAERTPERGTNPPTPKTVLTKADVVKTRGWGLPSIGPARGLRLLYDNILSSLDTWQPKGTREQLLAHLAKSKGTKDEAEWIGLGEWLKDKPSVTRDQVREFVEGNRVNVEEVTHADEKSYDRQLDESIADALGESLPDDGEDTTKFSQYQLPGGEGYRELLLTLPAKEAFDPSKVEIVRKRNSTTQGMVTLKYDGKEMGTWADEGTAANGWMRPKSELIDLARQLWEKGSAPNKIAAVSGAFHSSHWDEPNVLAHVRFNERTLPDGRKIAFLEEIQSDWHQQGRSKGYMPPGAHDPYTVDLATAPLHVEESKVRPGQFFVSDLRGSNISGSWNHRKAAEQEIAKLREQGGTLTVNPVAEEYFDSSRPPDAPFKGAGWKKLALKRMLIWAAENGMDGIGWTTGEQQAERYDLSKQINALYYRKNPDGTFMLEGDLAHGGQHEFGDRIPANKLDEYVGKDMAAKIVAGEGGFSQANNSHFLKGTDLKVGGEGMRGFYDRELPSLANDLAKQWGVKVGTAGIQTLATGDVASFLWKNPRGVISAGGSTKAEAEKNRPVEDGPWTLSETQSLDQVHFLPLPESVRSSILQKGMPLFSVGPNPLADKATRAAAMDWADALIAEGVTDPKAFADAAKEDLTLEDPRVVSALWDVARLAKPDLAQMPLEQWEKLMAGEAPSPPASQEEKESVRMAAIGAISLGKVDQLERAGREFFYGTMSKEEREDAIGPVSSAYIDRLAAAGIGVRRKVAAESPKRSTVEDILGDPKDGPHGDLATKTALHKAAVRNDGVDLLEELRTRANANTAEPGNLKLGKDGGARMPLVVEKVRDSEDGEVWSLAHYFIQNGDLMSDPEMELLRTPSGSWLPMSFTQSSTGTYDVGLSRGEDGELKVDAGSLKSMADFLNGTWLRNLEDWLHLPTEAEASAEEKAPEPPKKPDTSRLAWESFTGEESPSQTIATRIGPALLRGETLSWKALFGIADRAFGGTQAAGKYTPKDAYDAVELAVNRIILSNPAVFNPQTADRAGARRAIAILDELMSRLPTQSKRTEEMDEFQQFSTPPPLAFIAAYSAGLNSGDVAMEPSAGIGGLASFVANALGSRQVWVNELSERREALLKDLADWRGVTREDAEHLHALLPKEVGPTVVVMNPPFSSTAGKRTGVRDTRIGGRHVEQALARLRPGGRLVAIVGRGMGPDAANFKKWWRELGARVSVRANISVSGDLYSKMGTSFDNQLVIIDKIKPKEYSPVVGKADSWDQLLDLIEPLRHERPTPDQRESRPVGPGAESPQQGDRVRGGAGQGASGKSGGNRSPATSEAPRPDAGGDAAGVLPLFGQPAGGEPRGGGSFGPSEQSPAVGPDQGGAKPVPESAGALGNDARAGGGGVAGRPGNAPVRSESVEEAAKVTRSNAKGPEVDFESDSIFSDYTPRKVAVKGAKPHPTPLVETSALAMVEPPDPVYQPKIPKEILENGAMSLPQFEAVVYAGQAHAEHLPDGSRRGYFVGDGTGAGKTRIIAGVIIDNWNNGRQRSVVATAKAELMPALRAELDALGGKHIPIRSLNDVKSEKGSIELSAGIVFTSYATLRRGISSAGSVPPEYAVGAIVERGGEKMRVVAVREKSEGLEITAEALAGGLQVQDSADEFNPVENAPKDPNAKKTRVDQIAEWFGTNGEGVVVFDESHNAGNAVEGEAKRGKKEASQQGMAVLALQHRLKNGRVLYSSATGATEVSNLAYADRLGLWGPGLAFTNRAQFINEVKNAGLSAMELVAQNMKGMGLYLARSLSWKGVTMRRLEHKLTTDQRGLYDEVAKAWQLCYRNMERILKETNANKAPGARSAARSAFFGAQIRFFDNFLTSLQMPSVLADMKAQIAAGNAILVQLTKTNEADEGRELVRLAKEGKSLEEFSAGAMGTLLNYVNFAFPTQAYDVITDADGNEIAVPVRDAKGNPVEDPAALEAKQELLDKLALLKIPTSPLQQILDTFGADKVAEITGRDQRVVTKPDPKTGKKMRVLEKGRSVSNRMAEMKDYENDKRIILMFSDAGGTGFGYHSGRNFKNQRRRIHYLVQPGWIAANAVQGCGRGHRANEANQPDLVLVSTDIEGHKRFMSTIARRLAQLGALTSGERRASTSGLFNDADNLENHYASTAIHHLFMASLSGQVPVMPWSLVEQKLGFPALLDKDGRLMLAKLPPVSQFLNRLLNLEVEEQNAVFKEFYQRMSDMVESAKASGRYDDGLETLRVAKGGRVEKVSDDVVYQHPTLPGVKARLVSLKLVEPAKYITLEEALRNEGDPVIAKNKRSGKVYVVASSKATATLQDGRVVKLVRRISIRGGRGGVEYVPETAVAGSYEDLDRPEGEKLWKEQVAAAPSEVETPYTLLVGAVLPVWDRLGMPQIDLMRTMTADGEPLLGVEIPSSMVRDVRRRMGVGATKMTPEELTAAILDGERFELANGWKLTRATVSGEPRIEIRDFGPAEMKELRDFMGCFVERINFIPRVFVPTDPSKAAEVLKKVLAKSPVVQDEESAARPSVGPSRTPASPLITAETAANFATVQGIPNPGIAGAAIQGQLNLGGSMAMRDAYDVGPAPRPRKPGKLTPDQAREDAALLTQRTWGDPEYGKKLSAAFARGGGRVSSLIHSMITGELPAFNLKGAVVRTPEDFAKLLWTVRTPNCEVLKAVWLNEKNEIIHSEILTVGLLNQTMIHSSLLLRGAQQAAKFTKKLRVVMAHNHPSGDPKPSTDDIRATREMAEACRVAGIELVDHVITDGGVFVSLQSMGVGPTGWPLAAVPPQGRGPVYPPRGPEQVAQLHEGKPSSMGASPESVPAMMQMAPWEAVQRWALPVLERPEDVAKLAAMLRQAEPRADFAVYVNTRLHVLGVEILPPGSPTTQADRMGKAMALGAAREAAAYVMVSLGGEGEAKTPSADHIRLIRDLAEHMRTVGTPLVDASAPGCESFKRMGIIGENAREYGREESKESLTKSDAGGNLLRDESEPYQARPGHREDRGGLEEEAAAVARGSGGANPILARVSQERALRAWAEENGYLRDVAEFNALPLVSDTTGENEVRLRSSDNRAVKLTHPGWFGFAPRQDDAGNWIAGLGTPLQYLERIINGNRAFGDDVRLEGMVAHAADRNGVKVPSVRFLVSQPWRKAADMNAPHPSEAEIIRYMKDRGFHPIPGYHSWRSPQGGFVVVDARPANFIKTVEGIFPVDLPISEIPPASLHESSPMYSTGAIPDDAVVLIPHPEGPGEEPPDGIKPGYYNEDGMLRLLALHHKSPEAVLYLADMVESGIPKLDQFVRALRANAKHPRKLVGLLMTYWENVHMRGTGARPSVGPSKKPTSPEEFNRMAKDQDLEMAWERAKARAREAQKLQGAPAAGGGGKEPPPEEPPGGNYFEDEPWDDGDGEGAGPNPPEPGDALDRQGDAAARRGETGDTPNADVVLAAFMGEMIPGAWKRAFTTRLFWESAVDTLTRAGGALAELAEKIRTYYDLRADLVGRMMAPFRKVLQGLSRGKRKAIMAEFAMYMQAREGGDMVHLQEIEETLQPETRGLIEAIGELFKFTSELNRQYGVQVMDPREKEGWRNIGSFGESYWPRVLQRNARRALQNPRWNPKLYEELANVLKEQTGVTDPERLRQFIKTMSGLDVERRFFSHLETARIGRLPPQFYEYRFEKVMPWFIDSYARRISQIAAFGQRIPGKSKDAFELVKEKTPDKATQQYIIAVQDGVYERSRMTALNEVLRDLRWWASFSKLSNPWTAIRNTATYFTNTMNEFGIGRASVEGAKLLEYGRMARESEDAGALRADLVAGLAEMSDFGAYQQAAIRVGHGMAGYSAVERWSRSATAATALNWARWALKVMATAPNSRDAVLSRAKFSKYGVDADALREEFARGETGFEVRRLMRAAVADTQFAYDLRQLPAWCSTPNAKFLLQFMPWGLQQLERVVTDVVKPAFYGYRKDGTPAETFMEKGATRDWLKLLTYLALSTATGEALYALKEMLFGTHRADASMEEIENTAGEDRLQAAYLVLQRFFHDQLYSGGFGILGDWAGNLEDVATRQRAKSPLNPPGIQPLANVWENLLQRYYQQHKLTAGDWLYALEKEIPLLMYGDRILKQGALKLGLASEMGGAKLQEVRADMRHIRLLGARWASEVKADVSQGAPGDFSKNPNTPIFGELQEALLLGDVDRACTIRDAFLDGHDEDFKERERRLLESVKSRQPVKVGGMAKEISHGDFSEWVQRREPSFLPKMEEIENRYQDTARAAGLWKDPVISRRRR